MLRVSQGRVECEPPSVGEPKARDHHSDSAGHRWLLPGEEWQEARGAAQSSVKHGATVTKQTYYHSIENAQTTIFSKLPMTLKSGRPPTLVLKSQRSNRTLGCVLTPWLHRAADRPSP